MDDSFSLQFHQQDKNAKICLEIGFYFFHCDLRAKGSKFIFLFTFFLQFSGMRSLALHARKTRALPLWDGLARIETNNGKVFNNRQQGFPSFLHQGGENAFFLNCARSPYVFFFGYNLVLCIVSYIPMTKQTVCVLFFRLQLKFNLHFSNLLLFVSAAIFLLHHHYLHQSKVTQILQQV